MEVEWNLHLTDKQGLCAMLQRVLQDIPSHLQARRREELTTFFGLETGDLPIEFFAMAPDDIAAANEAQNVSSEEKKAAALQKKMADLQIFREKLYASRVTLADQLMDAVDHQLPSGEQNIITRVKAALAKYKKTQIGGLHWILEVGRLLKTYRTENFGQDVKVRFAHLCKNVNIQESTGYLYIRLYKLSVTYPGLRQVSMPIRELNSKMKFLEEILASDPAWKVV
ncbi:hypothetical protein BOX15_Mlig026570g17 [Macrostomum lignano]|uniref:Uncharacterized protein n=3 Tax=Macrostomum lignano TaxID=282301 RepID=A0A267EVG5_9PLAT|nr:hypothetical protein BOX15_Mlig026570g12 [Macrostomum lignano]PAA63851.1 hypothetical protein BOX15_Mlig026570g7 [Macrostomum lignano]PAA64877.1 hypothetical protein BOX15_Mlig029242g1 [Macrostomum lignano]PAA89666.1 hypothetical protein BOX15_Mlig026570g4 [Macrostomum lignano]PAA92035.1 hypothetical protein BOX15_Mlig026570g17 [Macrostomum lignano]